MHAYAILQKDKIIYSGFIEQEVVATAQNSGYNFSGIHRPPNDKDTCTLSYAEFVVPLAKAVQEVSEQNTALLHKIELVEIKYGLLDKRIK
ncbi:MAG: hypothetical protein JNK61_06290 [Bacteroidia bacterium]|nr:hypothetical protein [Bacteroidia bacterium]HQV01193.1 hypothetical protein [Bacteroidia bacterium]